MPRQTILVIDDEQDIQKLIQYNLEKEGYQLLFAKTGEEGFELARAKKPDLILLDLMLPGIDGLEVCRMLHASKETRSIPILMLTAKSSETDQIVGLELGASDYIAKPFSVKVLQARIKNIFRSGEKKEAASAVLKSGDFLLDKDRQSFTIKGKPISFTKLEFRILSFLMENPGKVFSRDKLLSGAWDGEAFVIDRTVDAHVHSIRQKLGKYRACVGTVRGTGYRFLEAASAR
jgi:two-component system, OmpR family, alkaline phosphatase synthesis response regulator PhoP